MPFFGNSCYRTGIWDKFSVSKATFSIFGWFLLSNWSLGHIFSIGSHIFHFWVIIVIELEFGKYFQYRKQHFQILGNSCYRTGIWAIFLVSKATFSIFGQFLILNWIFGEIFSIGINIFQCLTIFDMEQNFLDIFLVMIFYFLAILDVKMHFSADF